MQLVNLGKTNIRVSRLCFGGLTVGPLQANLSIDCGAQVIATAIELGVNFIDTAQLYLTYPYIKKAMSLTKRYDLVIASKTYSYDKKSAAQSIDEARRSVDRDYIDIFMLHEQESEHTLRGHREALDYLCECKQKGIIRAVGISTHHIAAVNALFKFPEIEVIHPIINYKGLGIADGNISSMLHAVQTAYNAGIGIYSMKPLGGGNLIDDYHQSLDWCLNLPYVHSIALGMQSEAEVIANVAKFNNAPIPTKIQQKLSTQKRNLHIENWCESCGNCIPACKHGALSMKNNKLTPNRDKCVLCGYCGAKCPNFAIKVC